MKKSLLIASTLAMVLGVGVAVGARQAKAEKVEAANTTVYCKCDKSWWTDGGAAIGVHYWGSGVSGTTWPGIRGTLAEYEDSVWQFSVPSEIEGLIFTRVNSVGDVADWGAKTGDLTLPTDGKNMYTITSDSAVWGDPGVTGSWGTFVPKSDPVAATNSFYVYDEHKVLGNTFASINLYGFGQADSIKPMSWPGSHTGLTDNQTVGKTSMYKAALSQSYTKCVINNSTVQTVDVENISSHVDDVLVVKNTQTDGKYDTEWKETSAFTDYPASDGYYLVGTKTSFRYEGAISVPALAEKDAHNNIAILRGYTAALNEKIKVRSYFEDVDTWYGAGDASKSFGERDEYENFKFTTAGSYDIYVQDNGKFYVSEHQEFVNIGVVNRFFTGKTMTSYENGSSQDCVKGQKPTLIDPSVSGYVFRGWFTNAGCTEAFDEDTVLNNDITLQAKFTKVGYYTISEAGSWSIDNADPMTTEDIASGNNAETSVTVAAIGERYSFVEYDSAGVMHGQSGVGENDGIATYDSEKGNVVFSKTGTFAVYLSKDGKVYLNAGAAAFYTNFLNDVSAVCNTVGSEGYIANLQAEWAEQKIAYTNLTDDEKNAIKAVGFNGGSDVDDLHKVVKKYNRIVTKYGTALFEDFIWGQKNIEPQTSVLYPSPIIETSNIPVIVIVAATITAISLGLFFILKKKETK